ncbi:DUF695 domain-containing protein [uncultured Erythrobacter sp.]|uniref:DUF695 domain-containing protein n=1 Tax=uncultured Erythrobacter sp. TaxID=263913 RepID=UPI0026016FBD|nr:DUF695 domain-containing protein [uncultured Erythrobacter sp.]
MSKSGIFPTDDWTVAQGATLDGPIFMRYRTGEPTQADRERFDKLVIVRWAYNPDEMNGLPTSETTASMGEFEDPVLDASDDAGWWGSCVAIITHNGAREWRFYTPDVGAFQTEFSESLRGLGPYPLDLQVFDDPDWNGFAEVRALVG